MSTDADTCPVCKSSPYLNPNMRFLLNPTCYHKMCESCVDRIFSHGPARCPLAGCRHTLRKAQFRKPVFGDVKMEREVDIRRRFADVYNLREEDFEDLRGYNDYLDEVETDVYDYIAGQRVAEIDAKMQRWKEQHGRSIRQNATLADAQSREAHAMKAAEKEQAKLRREEQRRMEDEEKREKDDARRRVLDELATSDTSAKVILKKSSARAQQVASQLRRADAPAGTTGSSGQTVGSSQTFGFRGLKLHKAVADKKQAYDPFGGVRIENEYYNLRDDYAWDWLDAARDGAGGYDVHSYCSRALSEAFAGLGVFVGDERSEVPVG